MKRIQSKPNMIAITNTRTTTVTRTTNISSSDIIETKIENAVAGLPSECFNIF